MVLQSLLFDCHIDFLWQAEALSVLTPAQVAQLTLSSGALNDTDQIDHVFERLEEGNALENVDEFLEELTANGKDPDFQPAVRDHLMNRTFSIIAPHFPKFKTDDWFAWFHVKLVTLLPSFSAVMLKNATSDINCTNYHVVVSGMAKAFPSISSQGQEEITDVMVGYLKKSVSVINTPVCRQGIQSDAQWLEKNLGPFSTRAKYSDLKVFNISGVAVVENLSPKQKAELILDPDSNALENENIVREVFTSLTESPDTEQLSQFFQAYSDINKQRNITIVENPAVRDIILNLTLTALAPEFEDFGPEDYKLWFQVYLVTVMASLHPGSLAVIPSNISCASYAAMYEIIFLKSKVRHFGFCTMSKCGFRQVTKMCVFFPQTHWPRAKFENPATAAFTGCEIKQRVTQGDIRTYVDIIFQISQLPLL
ncbi:uncharacterized protein LOC127140274 [Lates calcarifer]|uniref:Uncharacterized protein LOC127140274 n=2 Tax=Lates calcarifer TaxID=8187 RepID=A0AAJ8B2Y3_LATCA|nr:uncharacterized protein LOC127140274 [Lates calcarifer]